MEYYKLKQFYSKLFFHPSINLVLKLTVSGIFVYWMLKNEKFNFATINLGLMNYKLGIFFFIFTLIQLILSAVRIKVLLHTCKSNALHLRELVAVSWAASFVTSVAPSSLFGDFFRIQRLINSDSKLSLDDSVYVSVLPKLLSMFGLVIISAVSGLVIFRQAQNLHALLFVLYSFLVLSTLLFICREKIIRILSLNYKKLLQFKTSPFLKNRINRLKNFNFNLIRNSEGLFQSFTTSLFIQIFNTMSFLIIILFMFPDIKVSYFYLTCLVPIGILIMTLPVSFFGLGVGHLAFSQLLQLAGIENGADIFTVFFTFSFIFNIMGFIPFIYLQRNKKMASPEKT